MPIAWQATRLARRRWRQRPAGTLALAALTPGLAPFLVFTPGAQQLAPLILSRMRRLLAQTPQLMFTPHLVAQGTQALAVLRIGYRLVTTTLARLR